MKTLELSIEGMSCGHCVAAVKGALVGLPGVTKVEVQVGRARVEVDETVARTTLEKAIADEGFRPLPA